MKKHALACVLCGILLASCAYVPHEVAITAEAPSTPDSVGNGVTVALHVIDDRDDVVVGKRGMAMSGADITAKDVVAALESELERGLEAKEFMVVSAGSDADAEFEAKLRSFKIFVESSFLTTIAHTSVFVNVHAEKSGKDFERSYRSNTEEREIGVPMGSAFDQKLNAALSMVLSEIMLDAELMDFLAQ